MKPFFWLIIFLSSSVAAENWQLDSDKSELNVTSVKKDQIAENHQFKRYSGQLSQDGSFTINIDLASLETNIPIRNERMQKFLFNTDKFASATLTGQCSACITDLKTGQAVHKTLDATLSLHGKTQPVTLAVTLLKTKKGLWVSSRQPVMINTFSFGLDDGVKKLQELAGLPRIDFSVPVTFSTFWTQQ